MTRYIIHIGPHKTGTTYIQNQFTRNRAELQKLGICYPTEWLTPNVDWCHLGLFLQIRRNQWSEIETVFGRLSNTANNIVVLSSEDLSLLTEDEIRPLKELTGNETEIVFYARRWSELLPSHAQEHIRQGGTRTLPEIALEYLAEPHASDAINFSIKLDRFAKVFGLDSIRILSYNDVVEGGFNLFEHFLNKLVGIQWMTPVPNEAAHSSLQIHEIELLRVMNVLRSSSSRSSDVPRWYIGDLLPKLLRADTAKIQRVMERGISHIIINEVEGPLDRIYSVLVQKYGKCILTIPKDARDARLFARKKKTIPYIDPNYILMPEIRSDLQQLYFTLTGNAGSP